MSLSEQEQRAVENGEAVSVKVGNSECIIVRKDIYYRVSFVLSDGSGITDEVAVQLGWESGKSIGWETPEMAEYDNYDLHTKPI